MNQKLKSIVISSLLLFSCYSIVIAETVQHTYDNLDRVTRIESDDSSMLITYTYDSAGNRLTINSQGLNPNMNVIDEGDYTVDTNALNAQVSFYGEQYGYLTYMYALGTSCQGIDIQDWGVLDVGSDGSMALSGLALPYGPVFISVYVLNYAGDDVTGVRCSDGITVLVAAEDPDTDGLNNAQELTLGTDPFNEDTDSDQYDDGLEVNLGYDPTDPDDNPAAVADAGEDQNAITGRTVQLDGSGSYDPKGLMIHLQWSFTSVPAGSSVTDTSLSGIQSAKPSFITDVHGTYELLLTVDDGITQTTDTVVINADQPNIRPNVHAGFDKNALTGSPVSLDGSRSNDPDHGPQPLTYQWTLDAKPVSSTLINSDLINADTWNAQFTPDVDGIYILRISVSDGNLADVDFLEITSYSTVVPPNADAGDDIMIYLNESAYLDGSGCYDPDDAPQPLSHNWRFVTVPNGSSLSNNEITDRTTASPYFTPDLLGTFVVELTVSDGQNTDTDNVAVTVCIQGDSDCDGILDDGDGSGVIGDYVCIGGNTVDCDDNCTDTNNKDQADFDGDRVGDQCDNCECVANDLQIDTDADGYGNRCDADLNNDWFVNAPDFGMFAFSYGTCEGDANYNPDANLTVENGDVCVNAPDFGVFAYYYGKPLGYCQ